MPMRWTPENDQTLLLKIIEVSNVNPDTRAIAELWPTKEGEERPTPRAITERLHKIRAQVRAAGGNFSISGKGKGKAPAKDPLKPKAAGVNTPRKPRAGVKKEEASLLDSSSPKVKHEAGDATPGSGPAGSNFADAPFKSDSGNNSDGGSSSQHEPLTPASAKRKHSFDVTTIAGLGNGAAHYTAHQTAHEAEDVPAKRQIMASPTPASAYHHSFGSMTMDYGMNMNMPHGFQYMDQNEA